MNEKQTLDLFCEVNETAYAALDGAIDGIIGTVKRNHGDGSAAPIFLAMQMALMKHAARLAFFTTKRLGQKWTAERFAEFAADIFRDDEKLFE